ncbi:MAG TPA: DUF1080 domain-containing protein [Pirellulaceae bacterium]|jgi:hypothetical protein|nr:DUF1080 domain-containing protein [Pirellulaceae bacterium]
MLRKFAFLSLCLAGLMGSLASGFADEAKPADESGFQPLFDGKTLEGWEGDKEGYEVRDGAIVCIPSKGGFLYTDKDYSDFALRFEFKLGQPNANNGIGIRVPFPAGDPAYSGMEIQVLDENYKGIAPYQAHGSVYGIVAAKRGHQKPNGEWNEQEIRIKDRHITVTLNGVVIVDANLDEATKDGTLDKKEHPGLDRETGRICFCGHGAEVAFRNVRLEDLSEKK